MVRVVLHVPGGHILEQYVICSKDLIRLGMDLSSVLLHTPCATILKPRLTLWE